MDVEAAEAEDEHCRMGGEEEEADEEGDERERERERERESGRERSLEGMRWQYPIETG